MGARWALLAVALLALLAAGCGGGGDDSTGTTAAEEASQPSRQSDGRQIDTEQQIERIDSTSLPAEVKQKLKRKLRRLQAEREAAAAAGERAASTPPPAIDHEDSGGGAEQFLKKGADNSIQESGEEASASEREEAATALHGYLDSSARNDWDGACFYLAEATWKQLATAIRAAELGCPAVLEAFFAEVPAQNLRDAAQADVGSLRVDGTQGFLLYHGSEDLGYVMPMGLEDGKWKVAAVAGSALL